MSVENSHITSKVPCGELVGSLLVGANLNYIGHRSCIFKASAVMIKKRGWKYITELYIWKEV